MMFPAMPYYPGMMDSWWGVGTLLFWAAVIVVGVLVVRRAGRSETEDSARRILDERFARGEIDAEERSARRRVLEGRG